MNKVARLPAEERRSLFEESAHSQGLNPAVIEKDFWVCGVLKQLPLQGQGASARSSIFPITPVPTDFGKSWKSFSTDGLNLTSDVRLSREFFSSLSGVSCDRCLFVSLAPCCRDLIGLDRLFRCCFPGKLCCL